MKPKLIVALFIMTASLYFAVNNSGQFLYGDALGYYVYLPASFIHHKLDKIDELAKVKNIPTEIRSGISRFKDSYSTNEKGYSIIQYSYGLAALEAPGFFTVYLWDKLFNKSPTGFEIRYQNALVFLNIFYLLIGLFFCYKSIIQFFPTISTIAAIIFGLIGSNLFWFGFIQYGMMHIPQFMLISLLIFLSIKLRRKWSDLILYTLGFLMGLITILRPVDIIFGLIPLIIIIEYIRKNKNYRSHLLNGISVKLLFCIILFLLPIIPQLFYWKMMTGSLIYDSYKNYHFHWTNPHIIEGLFGAKNGWFMYSPIMILAAIGLFNKYVPKVIKICVFIILPLHIYISYSWYNYNYINGFGSRPMIHIYPLMLFGIAGILSSKKIIYNIFSLWLILVAVYISMSFTYKQSVGKLFSDESTWAFNKNTFHKKNISYYDLFYLNSNWDQSTLSKYTDCKSIGIVTSDTLLKSSFEVKSSNKRTIKSLNPKEKYPIQGIDHIISNKDIIEYKCIRSTLKMSFTDYIYMPHQHHKLIIEVVRNNKQTHWECISINDKINKNIIEDADVEIRRVYTDTWGTIDYHFPLEELKPMDLVKIYLWNPSQQKADFDYMAVSLCK